MISRLSNHFIHAGLLTLAALGSAHSETPSVFASGLQFPSRIIVGPNGNLLVTESTASPNTGRISLLDRAGARRTVLDGLPSGPSAPGMDVDGPNGLALAGRTLYIANGEGDSFVKGPRPRSILPNPDGPSSPMFSTILRVTFSGDVDKLATGFSLKPADHFTLMDGGSIALSNQSGDTATVTVLTAFRPDRPDPESIYRNTHLYGLALLPSQANTLYAVDAGNNVVWQVDLSTGKLLLLTRFPNTPNPTAPIGPPTSEAVPTSVRQYGSHLLVTLLAGAPFVPLTSRVMEVDPATGNATLFISLLSSTIDSIFRERADGSGQWFVLQYSVSQATGAPGRLQVYNTGEGETLADRLNTPTGLAFDESTNDLYIVSRGDGAVLRINVGR